MAEKLPLIYIDGALSQLPPGVQIEGGELGNLIPGSGLVGGGDLQTGNKRLDVALASNPSGVIFVGDTIGMDGADIVTADVALSSGNAALVDAVPALASGVAGLADANTALASGNAALTAAVDFAGSSSVILTASSVIQAGNPVGLDDNGRVSAVVSQTDSTARSFGTAVTYGGGNDQYGVSTYDSSGNKIVIAYSDQNNSNYLTANVGEVSGSTISFPSSPVVVDSAWGIPRGITYDTANSKVVVCYTRDAGGVAYGAARVGTITGTTSSWGSSTDFNSFVTNKANITYDSFNQKVVVVYEDTNNSNYGTAKVGTVTGTSISFGGSTVFRTVAVNYLEAVFDPDNNVVVVVFQDDGGSDYGIAIAGTVSGTSISFPGSAVTFSSVYSQDFGVAYDTSNQRLVIAYYAYTGLTKGHAVVGSISGTTITFGSVVEFLNGRAFYNRAAYDSTLNQVVLAYKDFTNSSYGSAVVGTVDDLTISFGPSSAFSSVVVNYIGCVYDSSNQRVVVSYTNDSNQDGEAVVGSVGASVFPTLNSVNNFIGSAQSTVASGDLVTVNAPRSIDYSNTGLLTGYFYYVDPTASGFTTTSGQADNWSAGSYSWAPVAKAVSPSGLLILDTI